MKTKHENMFFTLLPEIDRREMQNSNVFLPYFELPSATTACIDNMPFGFVCNEAKTSNSLLSPERGERIRGKALKYSYIITVIY
jgi:hypothetical protein